MLSRGLGAAAGVRGQMDDVSIFNLMYNLALRERGAVDRRTVMCEHRCSTLLWRSGGVVRQRLFDDYYIFNQYY